MIIGNKGKVKKSFLRQQIFKAVCVLIVAFALQKLQIPEVAVTGKASWHWVFFFAGQYVLVT